MNRLSFAAMVAIAFGAWTVVTHSVDAQGGEARPLRVLFIGNSYTYRNDLPDVLRTMAAKAGGRPLETARAAGAGMTLADHLRSVETVARIRGGRWDYVVLQDQGTQPLENPKGMQAAARELNNEITKSGARTLVMATWARKSKPETQALINHNTQLVADAIQAEVVPVGAAWQTALADPAGLRLYDGDGSHPSRLGTFLAASTLFATLYDRSPEGLAGTVFAVEELELRVAQKSAWNAVKPIKDAQHEAEKKRLELKLAREKAAIQSKMEEPRPGPKEEKPKEPAVSAKETLRLGSARRERPRASEVVPEGTEEPSSAVSPR